MKDPGFCPHQISETLSLSRMIQSSLFTRMIIKLDNKYNKLYICIYKQDTGADYV